MLNVENIRKDFPILNQKIRGKQLVFLDSAATSQKPNHVIEAISEYYRTLNANIHRGIYFLSEESTFRYEAVRQQVSDFMGAGEARSIIFTRNTTESINIVAQAWGRKNIKEGDEILITEMEHHSNLVPWQMLAQEKGAELIYIPVTDEGLLDLSQFETLLTKRTKLMALTHVSNVLGTINDIKSITKRAHENGTIVVVDGAQAVPHLPVNVKDLGCDFYAFSAHKMLGPTGVGILYGKPEILESMPPFLGGGEMILEVQKPYSTWKEIPWKFEAGTPNFADVIAFSEAMHYLENIGYENIRKHEQFLTEYALKQLKEIRDIILYGPKAVSQRSGVISFSFTDLHPHDIGTLLDHEGVAIRAGHHCAQVLMRKLGVPATARASFYLYNTKEEIDILVHVLGKAREYFNRGV